MARSKKLKKIKKVRGTKLFFTPSDESSSEDKEDEDEDIGGVFLEKEDVQIIYNSLRTYKPTAGEEQRYELLLEEFDEILTVDYDETPSDIS